MKNYKKSILIIMAALGFNACLDQDPLFDPSKSSNIIEFYDLQNPVSPLNAPHHLFVNSLEIGTSEELPILISYSGAHGNDRDLEIDLGISTEALDDYNEFLVEVAVADGDTLADGSPDYAHILQYDLLPASFYSIPSMSVTMPAGETKLPITIVVNTSLFDFAKAYVLPLKIVGSSRGIISGNYGVTLLNVGAKNIFHGSYTSTGLRTNFSSAANWDGMCCPAGGTILSTAPWNFASVSVATVNEFTSTVHAANSNGGFGTINITVDPATNVVTVASNATTALANLVPMQPSAGKVSMYHPATRTFELYYQYTNVDGSFRTVVHTLVGN